MGPAAMPAPFIFCPEDSGAGSDAGPIYFARRIRGQAAMPLPFIFAGMTRVPATQPGPFVLEAQISIASATRAATNCDAVPLQNGSK